jgi:hypothetical protein
MLGKSIAGIDSVKFFHHTISGDLGYDRSTSNGETQFVAPGYPSLRDGALRQSYSIDNEEVRLFGQFFHRLYHCQLGGLEDINGVNHLRRNDANAYSHRLPVNQVEEGLPLSGV